METNATFKLQFEGNELEISGSEDFVSKQIETFKEAISERLKSKGKSTFNLTSQLPASNNGNTGTIETLRNLSHIFHIEGEEVKIIKKISGNGNSEKSVKTAIIYLWAKSQLGINEIPFKEIRELCEEQGCLDSGNFASHMKSAKEHIVVDGKGKSQICKLTIPGKDRAVAIIQELAPLTQ